MVLPSLRATEIRMPNDLVAASLGDQNTGSLGYIRLLPHGVGVGRERKKSDHHSLILTSMNWIYILKIIRSTI